MRGMRARALAFLMTLAVGASACGSGGTDGAPDAGAAAADGAPVPIEVTLSDFAIEPSPIVAPGGSPLSILVTNSGQAPHTFAIMVEGTTYETPEIQAGSTATLAVPALAEGEYDVLCTVPGHSDLGMTGTLTASSGGASMAPTEPTGDGAMMSHSMTAQEMAEGHEKGVLDFVSQLEDGPLTEGAGNQPLEPVLIDGVKVFELTVDEISWEVAPGRFVDAMAFNGQIPGPEVRVRPGDTVRFVVQNQLEQPFSLHFHGVTVPNEMDGVPYVTQPPVMPGERWEYEFEIVDPPGMYVYHSHFNSTEQVGKGLYAPLIIEPKDGDWSRVYGTTADVEATMFPGDGPLGYNLNGKSFPATQPILAERGDTVLIHLANDGSMLHPMHLHGFHFLVVGVDGFPLDADDRYMADTLVVAPGSRYDILVEAAEPGVWAFHCHILPHVEGPEGMFGMVTAVIVS